MAIFSTACKTDRPLELVLWRIFGDVQLAPDHYEMVFNRVSGLEDIRSQ